MLNMTSYRLPNNNDRYVVKLSNYSASSVQFSRMGNEESRWLVVVLKYESKRTYLRWQYCNV